MLMTYYCPTHGDIDVVKPIEILEEQISKKNIKKEVLKNNYKEYTQWQKFKILNVYSNLIK